MERSSSVATWEFMKEPGSSEDDVGSQEDEEDELRSLNLKRKGLRLPTSRASPKRPRTAAPSRTPTGPTRLNGNSQASAGFFMAKSHRPRVSVPGPASIRTSLGTSTGKDPSGVVRSSQISVTPSFRPRSKSPQPTRLSTPGGRVKGKERSVNTGLPVPRSRSSSGPTKIPSKLRSEVIELSDSTDSDVPQYADTGPPSTIRTPNRFPRKSKKSPPSKGAEVINIDDSDEEISSGSKLEPGPKAVSRTVGPSSISSAMDYQSASSSPAPKPPHNGGVDYFDKTNVDSNLPSASQAALYGRRRVDRSDATTPIASGTFARKPTLTAPLVDLRSPFSGRKGPSRINSSKSPIGDTREPRPPVSLVKSLSQAKTPSAAPRKPSELDMSGLKDVLTDDVSLSSLRITPEKASLLSALPTSGRDLRPTLHSSDASAAMQSSKEYKASAHISSRPSDGTSECIDLTLDSDSDAFPPVPRPLPLPRPPDLASAVKSSQLLKEILTKPEPPTSPPLSKAKSRSTELDATQMKTASPAAAARNNTPIRPMPLPLPTPRPQFPSQEEKKTLFSVSMSVVQDVQPFNLLLDKSQSLSSLTRSPIDDTAYTSDGTGSSFGHTSRSASSSIEAFLPHRTARKTTRGRSSKQGLLSLSPPRSVSNSGPTPSISNYAALPEPGSSTSQTLVKSPPKSSNKPEMYATQISELMEVVTEDVIQVSSTTKRVERPNGTLANAPREPSPPISSVSVIPEPVVAKPFVESTGRPTLTFDNDSELEYVDDPVLKPSFFEPRAETDSTEMMDVEELLTTLRQDSPIPLSVTHEDTPDPLDILGSEDDLQLRRSTRSSRSASGEPMKLFLDDGFADSRSSSPRTTPIPPEDFSVPAPVKIFGGFQSLNWRTYRQNPENMRLKCYFSKDLPHTLQDTINSFSEAGRRHRSLRAVMEAAIRENTAEDEPDAPLIEIINEVDDDPTPPWEFHYSNKMWFGEDVPLPDLTKLVHCNCVGRCDPKTKPCACAERQHGWVDGMFHSPDFLYDSKGHVKATDYPVFECNDLCGCSDECRNRVVQHGRKCAIRIQKTAEKGWGVFAGAKKIAAGSFIGLYAGELLTDRVGEIRGITYNKFGRTYLFDLDFWHLKEGKEDWDIQYTVDAYHAGNFTRFLNHSCDPNCSLVPCYINDSDLQKPLLTVFAKRDIEPFEELCFSYSGDDGSDGNDGEVSRSSPTGDKDAVYVKCACKASNCTGYMFK